MATFGQGLESKVRIVEGTLAGNSPATVVHTGTANRFTYICYITANATSQTRSRPSASVAGIGTTDEDISSIMNETGNLFQNTAWDATTEDNDKLRHLMPGETIKLGQVGSGATLYYKIYMIEYF